MKSFLNPLGSFLHILFDVLFSVMYVQCIKPIQINVFQSGNEIQIITTYLMIFKMLKTEFEIYNSTFDHNSIIAIIQH